MKKYNFISGLPRSGSTLLSSILNQNPRFHASISDPLVGLLKSAITEATLSPGFRVEVPPPRMKNILYGIVEGYYKDVDKQTIFNTNRGWGNMLHVSNDLYPDAKHIVCVRDIGWILDSFEVLTRKNPYTANSIFTKEEMGSVYTRCNGLLKADRVIGQAYNALKSALSSEYKDSIVLVEYDTFVKNPEKVMKGIYNFIGEPYYKHDFEDVEFSNDEYDKELGIKGLHTVRKKVKFIERESILPQDILDSVKNMNFWKQAMKSK